MAKFYVNWSAREILTERERDERFQAYVDEMMEDADLLDDFLDKTCSLTELFYMDQVDREDLQERFHSYLETLAEEQAEEDFEEFDTACFQ